MATNHIEKHPTAIVHPDAKVGEGTRIGAFSVIDAKVSIGAGCDIQEHVIVRDHTTIGNQVTVFPHAVLGAPPQHLKYKGEPTSVVIGDRVTLREHVTIHRGTVFGTGTTVVKEGAYIMAYCHVAHDCTVGKNVVIANATQLAGHVEIGDYVVLGGLSAVTQFCRVGAHCFIGGASLLRKDLPPFMTGKGNEFHVQGINSVGLSRRGYAPEAISRVKKLFKIFYLQGLTVSQGIEKIVTEIEATPERAMFLDFIGNSKMGIIR